MTTHNQDVAAARKARKKLAAHSGQKVKATIKDISLVIWAKRMNQEFPWGLVKTTALYQKHNNEYTALLKIL